MPIGTFAKVISTKVIARKSVPMGSLILLLNVLRQTKNEGGSEEHQAGDEVKTEGGRVRGCADRTEQRKTSVRKEGRDGVDKSNADDCSTVP
jgi:hypothetical protein